MAWFVPRPCVILPSIPDSTIFTLCGWCRAEIKPGVIRCASCGAAFQGRERVPQLRIGVKLDSPPLSPEWEDDGPRAVSGVRGSRSGWIASKKSSLTKGLRTYRIRLLRRCWTGSRVDEGEIESIDWHI